MIRGKLIKALEGVHIKGTRVVNADNFFRRKTREGGDEDTKLFPLDEYFQRRREQARRHANRFRNIFVAPINVNASFSPPVHRKSDEDAAFIDTALDKGFVVFADLSSDERKTLIGAFEFCTASRNEIIISQGDVGDYFYVLRKGRVKFVVDGSVVEYHSEAGDSFGELALLYDSPRAATCISETECELWRLDQRTFRKILASSDMRKNNDTMTLLKEVDVFKDLDDTFLRKIAYTLKPLSFDQGDIIVRRGDQVKYFYVVKDGELKATEIQVGDIKYDNVTLGPGDAFGHAAISRKSPAHNADVKALGKVTLLCMSKEDFENLCGDLDDLFVKSVDKYRLKSLPLGKDLKLDDHEVDSLAKLVVDKKFCKGHVFFEAGKISTPVLYLLRSGKISIQAGDYAIEIANGLKCSPRETKFLDGEGFFGEDTLNPDTDDCKAYALYTATAEDDCKVGVLTMHAIESVLYRTDEDGIGLENLEKFRILGAGTFGKVWLVGTKDTKKAPYALKVQNKRQLIEYGQAVGVIRERNIMTRLDSSFIIKLANSYQDERHIYMLMKLYQGGELRSIMSVNGMPEWAAKFYAASILEGLSYMHFRHILHRDLKPENVLLDRDGYTVLIDLGFAKIVPYKTYTFCGTPLYTAPEIIVQKGHDKGADLWSWGVMLYEMIVGFTPFYDPDDDDDMNTLFKNVLKGKVEFPGGDYMSSYSKDLIKRMLVVKPTGRLGCFVGGDTDIRRHLWFDSIDFDKLAKKDLDVPWVPEVANPFDVSNFDNWDHLHDSLKDEKPLTAEEQRIYKDF